MIYIIQTIRNVFVFFCVGVMYSGEYDVCDVTLSVYPMLLWVYIHRGQAYFSSLPGVDIHSE
jgi:hypothetical protein